MSDFRSLVDRAGSIRAAARLLRVSPRAVSRWYAGREVPPGIAERLAAELAEAEALANISVGCGKTTSCLVDYWLGRRKQEPQAPEST